MKQFIICPKCGAIELTEICESLPFHLHRCEKCDHLITSDKWELAKSISIRQPWAFLCASGIKPIENRTWKLPEKQKGKRVLIHTGAKQVIDWIDIQVIKKYYTDLASYAGFNQTEIKKILVNKCKVTSAIIGSVEIIDCIQNSDSIWAEHEARVYSKKQGKEIIVPVYNWVLKDPVLFEKPILNVKGKLSFFIPQL